MNTLDLIILSATIMLIILFVLLKLTKVPKQIYDSKINYSDHRKEKPVKALFSQRYGLTGKPDYILHTKDGLVPLEIKSSKKPKQPYFSHVMQLVSYCLLIEEERGKKPKYGFLKYSDGKAFSVTYTENMKAALLKIMGQMRNNLELGDSPKPVRKRKCEKCSYKEDCFESPPNPYKLQLL